MVDCFVVYLAGHNRPTHEILGGNDLDLRQTYENQFIGMTEAEPPSTRSPRTVVRQSPTFSDQLGERYTGLDSPAESGGSKPARLAMEISASRQIQEDPGSKERIPSRRPGSNSVCNDGCRLKRGRLPQQRTNFKRIPHRLGFLFFTAIATPARCD
ncbi:hypothetical protein [Actimicrobium antarcticum]|uniref:hypothetical protein n=1 Tax=Actimicrobium antarcticum TaxID=1051899 RepID=UPI003CD0C17D